jgi:hypothetical protein
LTYYFSCDGYYGQLTGLNQIGVDFAGPFDPRFVPSRRVSVTQVPLTSPTVVPEPATLALVGAGVLLLAMRGGRRQSGDR